MSAEYMSSASDPRASLTDLIRHKSVDSIESSDEYIPPAVAISSIEIPFWNLVTFAIQLWFAILIASAIIGAVIWIALAILGVSISTIFT